MILPLPIFAAFIARANALNGGRAAGQWLQDTVRVRRMADHLQASTVWVNGWGATDAASPFNSFKQSG